MTTEFEERIIATVVQKCELTSDGVELFNKEVSIFGIVSRFVPFLNFSIPEENWG
jgi:hypothetical protein